MSQSNGKKKRSKFYSYNPSWPRDERGRFLRSPLMVRFEKKIDIGPGCWLWKACVSGKFHYGSISVNGHMRGAHRVAYELYVGPIPGGMVIAHNCGNKICVNPNHLRVATQQENMQEYYQEAVAQ